MRTLVIAPHPDDEVIGCGGAIRRHAVAGDEVRVLVVTRGLPAKFDQRLIGQTRREALAAHRLLGVASTLFLDFPAPALDTVPVYVLADALAEQVQEYKPRTVYLPHRGDVHGDHQRIYAAALVALRPLAGSAVTRVLSYETLSSTEWGSPSPEAVFTPNVFLDISAQLERKVEALQQFGSQLRPPPHPRSVQAVRALATVRGCTVGVPAAEAFMLIRETVRGTHTESR